MSLKKISLICSVSALLSAGVYAHDHGDKNEMTTSDRLAIEFVEPKGFTDIRPSNQSRTKFREHVLTSVEEYFAEFAEQLPEGQMLTVNVTDIDLAGDTRSPRIPIGSMMQDVRVMEDIYFPRMKFAYELKDESGKVLESEDEVVIKDMSFMNQAGFIRSNRDAFPYERHMIKEWFEDTLLKDKVS